MLNYSIVDKIIKNALEEDIPYGDITASSVITSGSKAKASLIAKEDGIICGLPIFERVFNLLGEVEFTAFINEGSNITKGDIIGEIQGNALNILMGERVALNLLQKMSGIATLTNKYVSKLKGLNTKLLDTRKTTPNLRILEKYAVKIGGGNNHRFSLSDGILIKDNHIGYAGSIKNAIALAKSNCSFVRKIEVETESKEEVLEALDAGADIIMLDNMSHENMREAMNIIGGKALVEVSGNVTKENIAKITDLGVDFVSSGALTHSAPIMDISLKNLHPVQE